MSGLDNTSLTVRTISATDTATQTDFVIVVASPTANVTVNLPAVATVPPGRQYIVKRDATATFTVTLDAFGSETINGATTAAVGAAATPGAKIIVSDGSAWHVIASY